MTVTFEQVFQNSLDYFSGDELAANVFASKYALTDRTGGLHEKSPADMHGRLAAEFARIEQKYENAQTKEQIFELFDNFRYLIPQGSPMAGIGNSYQIQSISNWFNVF